MIHVLLALQFMSHQPTPTILCPAYPGDPPWRPITCFILTHMGEPPDRGPHEQ
jgi:hypothetical protein